MQDCKDLDILIVTTTVGSEADAQRLARGIVERRLAACVQVEAGLRSVYRWQGRTEEAAEWRLTIKTTPATEPALCAWLHEQHPYDTPQYVVVPARASADYGAWVRAETAASGQ